MSDYERVERVIRYLEKHHLEQPSLAELAKVAGLSESHFHRLFTRWAGTTPKSFLKFLTAGHARSLLARSGDLLNVSLDSGLSGPGRLHDLFVTFEAMTPGECKAGGDGVEVRYGFHPSPFGTCLIGVTKRGVCYLAFVDGSEVKALAELRRKWPRASLRPSQAATGKAVRRIFFRRKGRKVPVVLAGTPFQLKVWEALLRIPPGRALSYAGLAGAIGAPKASRAVGTAVASNAIAYLIPCHRVIRGSGGFGQYRWGSARKQAVLAWEAGEESEERA